MAENDYSLQALNEFLDYLSSKHLLNKNTAQSRKAAVNKVLQVLDETEASDLRKVDMGVAFQRFQNKDGKSYKPESLMVYNSRLKSALNDFYSYLKSPAEFKPAVKTAGSASTKKRAGSKKKTNDTEADREAGQQNLEPSPNARSSHREGLTVPVPLREGMTVKVVGIPHDLTEAEALRLANIIKAYALP